MESAFPSLMPLVQHPTDAPAGDAAPRRGLLGRCLDALVEARRREAERHVAVLIQRSGGRLTDSLERAIARRFATR